MKKESTIVFTFLWVLILLGSQSCIVFGKDQKCQTTKDCDPAACRHGVLSCSEGICRCAVDIRRNVSFKKGNIYMGRCSCGCKPHCILGLCTCPCC